MTYSGSSSGIGRGTVTAHKINQWFRANGPSAAVPYAPDGRYKPPPDEVGDVIIAECKRYEHLGIIVNWDLIAADIAVESAFWQSRIVRDKNNPSGLGAVNHNPYDGAVTFSTPAGGIRATVAHWLNYFCGYGPWSEHDPRLKAMEQAKYMVEEGICNKLSDLNGRWAWPGDGYGQGIASRGNALTAYAATITDRPTGIIQETEINGVPFRVAILPSGNVNRKQLQMVPNPEPVIHETANLNHGANAEMHRRFMENGGGSDQVAWHLTVDDEEIIQHLPLIEGSWHAGSTACNQSTSGIEFCVNSDGDFNKTMANGAGLVRYLWDHGPAPKNKMRQHWNCSGKNCPARLRGGRWEEFVRLTQQSTPKPVDPNVEEFTYDGKTFQIVNTTTVDGHRIDMLDFFREMGGVPRLGYPIGGMVREDAAGKPRYSQETENVLMECWPTGFGNMAGPYFRFGRRLPLLDAA